MVAITPLAQEGEWKPNKENCESLFSQNPGLNIEAHSTGGSSSNLTDVLLSGLIQAAARTEKSYSDFTYNGQTSRVSWEHYAHIFSDGANGTFSFSIDRAPGPLGADPNNIGGSFEVSVPNGSELIGMGHSHSVGSYSYSRVTRMVRGYGTTSSAYFENSGIASSSDAAIERAPLN